MKRRKIVTLLVATLLRASCGAAKPDTPSGDVYIAEISRANEQIVSPAVPESITVNGRVISLSEENLLNKGDTLQDARLILPTGTFDTMEEITVTDIAGWKVLHVVPSVDTPVCSMQTKQLNRAAEEFSDVTFMTISADFPFAQRRFVAENNFEHMQIASDFQGNNFAKKHGMYMPDYHLSTRAIMVLDNDNKVQYIEYAEEVTEELDLYSVINFVRQNS